ncbi:MAG: hypothetical protein AABY22_25160 [Nanoarchaeota archaeon]
MTKLFLKPFLSQKLFVKIFYLKPENNKIDSYPLGKTMKEYLFNPAFDSLLITEKILEKIYFPNKMDDL